MAPIHEASRSGDLAQVIEILEQDPTLIHKKDGYYGENCCDSFDLCVILCVLIFYCVYVVP